MVKPILYFVLISSYALSALGQNTEMSSMPNSYKSDYYMNEPIDDLEVICVPNPTYDTAIFEYEVKKAGEVSVKIYNDLGHKIDEPLNKFMKEGHYEIQWSPMGMNLKGGVYYARVGIGREFRLLKVRYIHE